MSFNSSDMNTFSQVSLIDQFEQAIEKLMQVLRKLNITNKIKAVKSEATEITKVDESKTQALKLKYKLMNEVYTICSIVMILLMFSHTVEIVQYQDTKLWSQQCC